MQCSRPFLRLIHLHFFAFGAGEVKRYMRGLRETKALAQLLEIQGAGIVYVLRRREMKQHTQTANFDNKKGNINIEHEADAK